MAANKHVNYELLNLIGYGLAKFGVEFIQQFNFNSKSSFYEFLISLKIAETVGTIKNRQDLFDPFFDNGRKGWWQKGNTYIHRKLLIDSLFGSLECEKYTQIIKLYLNKNFNFQYDILLKLNPILISKFNQLQKTGLEAELFFLNNYNQIDDFREGVIQDARLLGDGYDFQIDIATGYFLIETKGVREVSGAIRLTQNEYKKAQDYPNEYYVAVVSNLLYTPKITLIENPIKNLKLEEKRITTYQTYYHSPSLKW